jgi:catechol 2,3-dioxygenase
MGGLFNLVSGHDAEPHADLGTVIGHVHLHVGDVTEGLAFYRDLVGFDLVTFMDSAAFVSAGGYHHHLAFNIWQGKGAPPAPPEAAGLIFWTVVLPSDEDVNETRDRLTTAGYATSAVDGGFEVLDPWQIATRFVASA